MFFEIAMLLDAADKASATPPGGPVTPPEQRLGIALLAALPNLAMEGATWPYPLSALQGLRDVVARGVDAAPTNDQTNDPATKALAWFDVALESIRAIDASENLYRQLAATGVVPRVPTGTEHRQAFVHATVTEGVNRVVAAAGLDAAARAIPALIAEAQQAGDFGPQHFAYYKLGYTDDFSINGLSLIHI